MKAQILLVGLLLGLALCMPSHALDHDQEGPGKFYYQQYEEEPWRSPESPKKLVRKSSELFAGALVISAWLYARKKRTLS